jgi:hypothetical protein
MVLSDQGDHPMTKLSDIQAVILSAASQRADGAVLPLPETLKIKGGAVDKVLGSLKAKCLIDHQGAPRGDPHPPPFGREPTGGTLGDLEADRLAAGAWGIDAAAGFAGIGAGRSTHEIAVPDDDDVGAFGSRLREDTLGTADHGVAPANVGNDAHVPWTWAR